MSGDGLFWAARLDAQGQVEFYRGSTPTPGAAEHHATPVRYLYMDETGVRKLSWPHCAAIDAAIAAQAQAEADARAQQEAARQAEREAEEAARPFPVSKIKVLRAIDAVGQLDAFLSFLNADAKRRLLWDAAVTLDSDDPMVTNAVAQLAPLLGGVSPIDFLRACKSDF